VPQGRGRVALFERVAEHPQESVVGEEAPQFGQPAAVRGVAAHARTQVGGLGHNGVIGSQSPGQRKRRGRVRLPRVAGFGQHAVDAVAVGVELVVTPLVGQHEDDEQAHRHGRGQPEHVDEREHFVLEEVPDSYFQVVVEHLAGL
jgi:virulence-associated protein VagC